MAPPESTLVTHRTAVITGGTRGFGRSLVRACHAAGWQVVFTGRDLSAAESLVAECPGVDAVVGDLRSPGSVERLYETCSAIDRPIDCLVNNAAVNGTLLPFGESPIGDWLATLESDLLVPIRVTHALLPLLARRGVVAIVGSSVGDQPEPGFSDYAVAKAGLTVFGRALGADLAGTGPTVIELRPGPMATPMWIDLQHRAPGTWRGHERVAKDPDLAAREAFEQIVGALPATTPGPR